MKQHSKMLVAAAIAMTSVSAMAVTPLWMRDVRISPDGANIAFTYKGDIYRVPAAGGQAHRVTTTPDYESNPVWSPDSRQIAFASDRSGNFDIYVVDARGGKPQRLTFDSATELPEAFTPDGKEVLFSAAIQDPAASAMYPSSRMTELYAVPVGGGAVRQLLATPVQSLFWGGGDTKNGWFVYQDIKGFEDQWRKHHTSSVTRDIWLYDAAKGTHRNLTARPGEDRDPVLVGNDLYFLSERDGGTINVYRAPLDNPSAATAVTGFKTHPVRFLSAAKNGVMAFGYDGEIYTMTPGQQPVKVAIDIVDDVVESPVKRSVTRASDVAPSPDGKSVAFVSRGEVFVTSTEYKTTKQITHTPEAEENVSWSPDGKTLYYDSQRNGKRQIYQATMGRGDDLNFANATVIDEKPVFSDNKVERAVPQVSPDGKKLAYIQDRNKLMVMDLATKKVTQVTDGRTNPERGGGFYYTWSPDSKWIALEIVDRKHEPYYDVAIVRVQDGRMINLTNTGYFAEHPRWVLDGQAVLYLSDQYGMRNHASWGSQSDAMLVFLNQDAYDKFRLSAEDYALHKELAKKNNGGEEPKVESEVIVEPDGIERRTVRLTPNSADIADAWMTADGETLYYIMDAANGTQLWKLGLRGGDDEEHKMVTKAEGLRGFAPADKGKMAFLTGRSIKTLDPKGDKLKPVTFTATMTMDPAKEREFIFDYMAREEAERFYTPTMHGVDWPAMTAHYRRFLPHISNNYDFAEMLSEILGELNVSHTGGRYSSPSSSQDDRTAVLGALYDMTWTGDGLKVDEVVAGSPLDRDDITIKAGDIITKINGQPIKAGVDNTALFNDIAGKKTLVTVKGRDGEAEYVVIPVSKGKFSDLLYKRWVARRAADVDRWSQGRLGYVHIPSMADPAFRTLYADVLGKYNDRDGIVIDIRWNGGGRMHEDIEVMFSGQKYLTQEIRGVDICDMPSRRWNKPSIMVQSEACYSNAHGTPWVYKHMGLGKLVGAPVPGTMTSVNWVTTQDPTLVFGIPVIGYRTAEGTYLENSQLEPDIEVYNSPETIVRGEDTQLHRAVDELLRQIDTK